MAASRNIGLDDAESHLIRYCGNMMLRSPATPPCDQSNGSPYLLIESELALYRDALSGFLAALRPSVPVQTVTLAELETAIACRRPWVLICSVVTTLIEDLVPRWILIHPSGESPSLVSVAGQRRSIAHPTIEELLHLVDELWGDPSLSGMT
jgi:hypothetical protein